jgi:hypothetical protein
MSAIRYLVGETDVPAAESFSWRIDVVRIFLMDESMLVNT